MKKTLHLTNAYHGASGGIRTFYRALLDGALRWQRPVRLVVPGERTAIEDVNPYARIYHLQAPRAAFIDSRYRLLLPHRYLFGRSGPLWRILHDERPDLIEVCDKYSLIYLGGLIRGRWIPGQRRPAVVALTCERMDDNIATFLSAHPLARHFARWYMRRVYQPQFDAHIAVSSYAADELPAGQRPLAVAPMGLDTAVFTTESPSPEARRAAFGDLGADRQAVVLLYVGRLSREKGLPLLLDVLATVAGHCDRSVHLVVAGDGPLRTWLEARGQAVAPGRVHLIGHVKGRQALARVYANADVLVHPNAREPYGLVPLEAMASGLPVVLPRAGGVLEYATDESAWLAEPNAISMADAVLAALSQPDARRRREHHARATAIGLDWSRVIERYFQIYDRIVALSAATRPVTAPRWPGGPWAALTSKSHHTA